MTLAHITGLVYRKINSIILRIANPLAKSTTFIQQLKAFRCSRMFYPILLQKSHNLLVVAWRVFRRAKKVPLKAMRPCSLDPPWIYPEYMLCAMVIKSNIHFL